jgi:catechol 2,3-dioxygenase-like lactoylglutathione lyase family enzyme
MTLRFSAGPLHQIAIRSRDLARSVPFYRDVLGARFLGQFKPPGLAFFQLGETRLLLDEAESLTAGGAVLYFRVSDIQATHKELVARGVSFDSPPAMIHQDDDGDFGPAGNQEWMAFFKDPDGNVLALAEQRRGVSAPQALAAEAYGPAGDPARHLPREALERGLRALALAPRDAGRVLLLVSRRADGVRELPSRADLTLEGGLAHDGWSRRPPRDPEAQLAVMRGDVAALIANGQPLSLFGDNLFVDLDLSAANLPVGTRLRVGEAVVAMTAQPHNGCHKFKGRFGQDALGLVQAKPTRDQNLRGVYWRVCEPGAVSVGAKVEVISRP